MSLTLGTLRPTAPHHRAGSPATTLRATAATRTAAIATVLAGTFFNAALCAAGTHGLRVSLAVVAATEVAIVATALLLAWRAVLRHLLVAGLILTLSIAALWLIDPVNDPKIVVELAMIGGFSCLGLTTADPTAANRLVWFVALAVLAAGLWEMFALESFERVFDVIGYYVNKGALTSDHINDTGTRLSENGLRPQGYGRQLLPGLLSLHRVGSLFLEPVSAGNFTVVCVAWVLARRSTARDGWLLILVALAIGVLADARFSVVTSAAVALVLATGLWRFRLLMLALPAIMIAVLLVIGATATMAVDNSIAGRLVGSGRLLAGWTLAEWFGLTQPWGVSMDTGYSYVLGNLGTLAAAGLWLAVALRPKPPAAARLFAAITVYLTLGLSTGYSSLSIKTAALLWFLYGTLLATPAAPRATGVRSSARTP